MDENLLVGIAAIADELRRSLAGRDSEIAQSAACLWVRLNDELIRLEMTMKGSINDMAAEMEDIDRQQEQELLPAYERLYLRLQKKLALTEQHRDLAEETLTRVETERLALEGRLAGWKKYHEELMAEHFEQFNTLRLEMELGQAALQARIVALEEELLDRVGLSEQLADSARVRVRDAINQADQDFGKIAHEKNDWWHHAKTDLEASQ